MGCWHGYLSGARCRLAYGPADATATHCLLLQQNPDWFTFLVLAHPGSPGKRAVKRVCVCVCVCVCYCCVPFDVVCRLGNEESLRVGVKTQVVALWVDGDARLQAVVAPRLYSDQQQAQLDETEPATCICINSPVHAPQVNY